MKIIAALTDPSSIRRCLHGMGLPTSTLSRSLSLPRSHRNSSLLRRCDDHLNLPSTRLHKSGVQDPK